MTGPMIDRLGTLMSLHLLSSFSTRSFPEGEQHDALAILDLVEHPVKLLLASHQGIDMFHRSDVRILRGTARATVIKVSPVELETKWR